MIYRKILFVPFQALTEEKNRILYLREEWEFYVAVPLSEYMTCNMHTASITKDESFV